MAKTLYLDCGMGAAGDMLTAALLELLPNREAFTAELNALSIPSVTFTTETVQKCGITGTHMTVKVNGEEESENMHAHAHEHMHTSEQIAHHHRHHHHSGMHEISHIIDDLPVSNQVKANVRAVYALIAEAESHVHNKPVTEIHFHEVGTMDAVADITAVCLLMERLAPEQVVVSPIHVGSGQVKCAHGILPVPAPATAYILRGVPIYGGSIQGELCTPTGAALLRHFATKFGDMPVMKTTAIGYGMGKKDFAAANCVRALLGETEDAGDFITMLECNLDDMSAEAVGFAQERLFAAGALDVYTMAAQMKKSRPGVVLYVMCRSEEKQKMVSLLFRHTTTLGVREQTYQRYTLSRTVDTVQTAYGKVRRKLSSGYGVSREKYEYEDVARIAREQGMSFAEIMTDIESRSHGE